MIDKALLNTEYGHRFIHPMPKLAPATLESPRLIQVLDRMSVGIKEESLTEFSWFAREYPRCYIHHLNCAEFRLRTIHKLMTEIHNLLAQNVLEPSLQVQQP